MQDVNRKSLIPDPSKSINEGGIAPLGEGRDTGLFKQLRKIAKKYDFSLSEPISKISDKAINYVLYGSEDLDLGSDSTGESNGEDRWYTLQEAGLP